MTLKSYYKLPAALPHRHKAAHPFREPRWAEPGMFRGETATGTMLTTPQRVVHYQVGGCSGGNICFLCDLRLTVAVVYRKIIIWKAQGVPQ